VQRAFEGLYCVQVRELTEARLLAGIHLVRVHSAAELSSAVAELPAYLASNPQVICSCIAVYLMLL